MEMDQDLELQLALALSIAEVPHLMRCMHASPIASFAV